MRAPVWIRACLICGDLCHLRLCTNVSSRQYTSALFKMSIVKNKYSKFSLTVLAVYQRCEDMNQELSDF